MHDEFSTVIKFSRSIDFSTLFLNNKAKKNHLKSGFISMYPLPIINRNNQLAIYSSYQIANTLIRLVLIIRQMD